MSEQPRTLEFRNNGVIDSLTLTMAPALFYENLRRELANAQRQGFPISVVSLTLMDDSGLSGAGRGGDLDSLLVFHSEVSLIEEVLIRLAFWWLVHGDFEVAAMAVDRIVNTLTPEVALRFHIHPWGHGQSLEDFVAEIDKAQFST